MIWLLGFMNLLKPRSISKTLKESVWPTCASQLLDRDSHLIGGSYYGESLSLSKLKYFAWLMLRDSLSHREVALFGYYLETKECVLCRDDEQEESKHLSWMAVGCISCGQG